MPSLFARPCQYPGCRKYAVKGSCYCEEHRKKVSSAFDDRRESSYKRGYNNKWAKARKAYLISHPLCVHCLKKGITKPATDVDHIVPHKGDMKLFWDSNNWQSLCHECHSRKTATEDSNFIRTPRGS